MMQGSLGPLVIQSRSSGSNACEDPGCVQHGNLLSPSFFGVRPPEASRAVQSAYSISSVRQCVKLRPRPLAWRRHGLAKYGEPL
jgi:hypothetical protein